MDEHLTNGILVGPAKSESVTEARNPQTMEELLAERAKVANIELRTNRIRSIFDFHMEPPSYPGGNYACQRGLNLFELFIRLIEIDNDEGLVVAIPDPDKRDVVFRWLINRIQAALPDGKKLTTAHIDECFANVSEEQLTVVVEQIALSGLTIKSEILGMNSA